MAMSLVDWYEFLRANSMFDWPLQTQTSPTTTLVNTNVLLPETVRVPGAPYLRLFRRAIHLPPLAVVVTF